MDRSRLRRGRDVLYNPTAAEVTALGAGPWPGLITQVNADGTVNLHVDTPSPSTVGAALADPLVTAPNGSDAGTTQTLANANKVAINAMVTRLNQLVAGSGARQKTSVHQGGGAGQFSLVAGADAV